MSFLHRALVRWPASDSTKIFVVLSAVIILSAIPTMRKNTRDGHGLFSSEKPAAIRGDKDRDFATEKAKVQRETAPQ